MLLQPRDANNLVLPSATKIDAQIYTGSLPHSSRPREKLASPRRLNCGLDHVGLEFQPSVGESADFHFGLPQFFEFVRQPQFRDGENVRAQTFANWLAIDFTARVICSRDDVLEQIRDFGERAPLAIFGQVRVSFCFPEPSFARRCGLVSGFHQAQLAYTMEGCKEKMEAPVALLSNVR